MTEQRDAVVRYLDQTASAAERAALERALVTDEALSAALGEELLLRHLLRHAPPEVPPTEVVARWEAAVLGELAPAEGPGWFTQAVEAFGWSVRGPALAVTAGPDLVRRAPRRPWWRRLLARGTP